MRGALVIVLASGCTCLQPVYDCSRCPGSCDPVDGCLTTIDSGTPIDAGRDAGLGRDGGLDAGAWGDAGSDAGLATDAGIDAGQTRDAGAPTDAGACVQRVVDPRRTGPAAMLGDSVVFQADDGGVLYWRDGTLFMLGMTAASGGLLAPRMARVPDGGLAVAWRTQVSAAQLIYALCPADCDRPASWQTVNLSALLPGGPWSAGVGLAVSGPLHVMVSKHNPAPNGGAGYLECTGNCGQLASWGGVNIGASYAEAYGADVEISDAGGNFAPRRTLVLGGDSLTNPSAMLVRECIGMCLSPPAWAGGNLSPGVFPDLVIDSQGLPRVFFLSSFPSGSLSVTRCTARPCTGPASTAWTTTMLLANVDRVSAGVLPDAGTWFSASSAGVVHFGVETPFGYAVTPARNCLGAPLIGGRPTADPSVAPPRWVFSRDGALWLQ